LITLVKLILGGKIMTQKELLYMEDAIGHEQNLTTFCENFSGMLEDKELSSLVTKLAKKHQALGEKLMKVMVDAKNE